MGFTGTTRFELVRKLGEGGMGVVYEAFDHERSMPVALKTLRNLDATSLYRFKREFRALSDVSHPNIVGLYELISHGDDWFFTMELLEGGDFVRYVRPAEDTTAMPTATLSPSSDVTQETREVDLLETPTLRDLAPGEAAAARPYQTSVDDRRLRRGLVQLAQALDAIHHAGMVHRDLKPSNVRVTPAGRIVLMDFGIVAEAAAPMDDSDEPRAIGTPSFMAPEQAAGAPVTSAADWYAFGVMLYVVLTGRLPFSGPRDSVLIAKQSQDPVPPSRIVADVPDDLARLCVDLLRRDPSARPSGEEVLLRLGADISAPETTTMGGSVFVGRGQELAALRRAYDEAREGASVACLVTGASGMGKSTLVRRFVHELGGAPRVRDAPVVLRGRCHERESLPYKAFDGIVDHLTHFLVGVSPERAADLLPEDIDLLTRVFPVLRRVPGVQTARPLGGLDRQELRRRAFGVLRELLHRIANWRPLVVGIDDLQWADEDSIDLLEALLEPPNPPAMLLIAAVRAENLDGSDANAPTRRALRAVEVAGSVHRLEVVPLSAEEQDQLVGRLMGTGALAFDQSLWRQSAGSPFFLGELVRYARERGALGSGGPPALDQVLRERIDALPPAARALLEAVAVAGEPTPLGALAEAVDLDAASRERAVAVLRVHHMVRVARHGQDPAVAPYHDRIRETLVASLDQTRLRDLHYRLAQSLERAGGTIDALARHWLEAGDREQAIAYLTSAAEAAQQMLAFGRAAELYRATLELGGHDEAMTRKLLEGMADGLAMAGRYFEAAIAYRDAAAGAEENAALELTRRSADNFLRSGHVKEGLDALGSIMKRLGIKYASTPRRALLSLAVQRVRTFFRGLRYTARSEPEIPARELGRLDTLYAASTTLGMIDHVRGADLQTRHLLQALRLGEEHRIVRALSIEAVFRAAAGGRSLRRAVEMSRDVELRARRIGDPYLVAISLLAVGGSAFLGARPRSAVEAFSEADDLLTNKCVGADWERITARYIICLAQIQLGELEAVARAGARFTAEAESHNDAYARNLFSTQPTTLRHLLADQPDEALAALDHALEGWPDDHFYMAHYFVAAARSIIHLYCGEAALAAQVLDEAWPGMRASQLHRIQWLMVEFLHYRSLAAAALGDPGPVHKMIRLCNKIHATAGDGLAHGHRGFLALRDGDESRGLELILTGQRLMEEADFRAIARGYRYRIATRTPGGDGDRIQRECLDWFRAQGAVKPERIVDLFVPPLPEKLRLALP